MKKPNSMSEATVFCPKPGRAIVPTHSWKWAKWLYPMFGLLSLIWFLVRVIPKPSRASYPCMRVAVPLASSFVVWLLGLGGSVIALGFARKRIRECRYVWPALCVAAAAIAGAWFSVSAPYSPLTFAYLQSTLRSEITADPANEPIGEPKGCNPGRVVWVHHPDATDWDGPNSGDSCWEPEHTDQAVVDSMMSRSVRWLAGESTDVEAWDALFRYFNREHGKGDVGYLPDEKIAIKINLTSCNASASGNKGTREKTTYLDKASDTSPQVILAALRQLVNVVGVDQSDISVGDPVSFFPKQWHDHMAPEFPEVHYLDHYPFSGRTQVQHSTTPFYWSTIDAYGKVQDYLPVSFVESDYIINLAVLKGHAAGITVCAKNHYGSLIRNPIGSEWGEQKDYYNLHESLPWAAGSPGRGYYRALVDLMGHAELGSKTVLYMIDGLYGGYYWEGTPYRWNMPPFNGDWPSSLFASQDPVAIDSVAYDFLREEWPNVVEDGEGGPGSLQGGAQDYLHEAALAHDPPSGTLYDPENDGSAMPSLGVHEHWNNPEDKQYSRNLGTGDGIELISSKPIIGDISFDECISELCQSAISVTASDPWGGNLTYDWLPLNGGTIIGSGSDVEFDPPDSSPHSCPYEVQLTVTSDASGVSTSETIGIYVKLAGDADGSGTVNVLDKVLVRNHFGENPASPTWDPRADVDCNGVVNVLDKVTVRNQFGQTGCACP